MKSPRPNSRLITALHELGMRILCTPPLQLMLMSIGAGMIIVGLAIALAEGLYAMSRTLGLLP